MATISVTVLSIISLLQIKIVYTADGNGGCRPKYGDKISNKMISNKIYGCKGTAGNLYYQCNDGYHWCENAQEVTELGLTPNQCIFAEENLYFITKEDKSCSSYPNNGITNAFEWGCLSESLMAQNNSNLCGPLIKIPTEDFFYEHAAIRGPLCCADPPSSGCTSTWSGWENYDKSVITLDELYACSSSNCSQGYHECSSEDEVKLLGLTVERCMNVAENDAFYVTMEFTKGNSGKCVIDENDETLIWGCSSSGSSAIHNQCGVLNSAIRLDASAEKDMEFEPIYNKNDLGVFCCTDNPGTGCVYKGIEREVVPDAIYACSSTYSAFVGYEELIDDIKYTEHFACNDGYHICETAREVQILGLKSSTCNNIEDNGMFYGTLEGRVSNKCGTDIIYGCSSNPNVNPSESCGVFNTVIDSTSLFETGGLLCCVDHDPVGPSGIGCADKYLETQVIENEVYACTGQYNNIEVAEATGCNAFYHVCNSAEELKAKGLTYEKCSNITTVYPDEFYATFEGYQDNNNKCQPSIDGMIGCSRVNSVLQNNGPCSPLNSVLQNNADMDGILCCADGDWMDIEWQDMPYMVSQRVRGHNCGGSILTLDGHNGNGVILTAAHCVTDPRASFAVGKPVVDNKDDMKFSVGCTTTACNTTLDSKHQNYSVENIVVHEKWGSTEIKTNDIALIFLTAPINHSKAIPIVIESDPMIAENNGKVKLTGYSGYRGDDARGGSDYDTLEYGITNIMAREECREVHEDDIIDTGNFCIKDDIASDNMITVCNGDSGSPLLYQGKQIGIASFIAGDCDPFYPQVAAYVPSYYQWIIDKCGAECIVNDGYIGCYKDAYNKYNSILTKGKSKDNFKDKTFTIDKCKKKCNGYKYFALQNDGDKCFCENDYELATRNGTSRECGSSKLGGILSNSLFVHSGFEQKQYLPDDVLKNGITLRYGPGKGADDTVVYTVESCRISCSHFKYFSVSKDGECKCDNKYIKSYNEQEYDRHGLFKNVLRDGIEIKVNCDNFLNDILFKNDEYNKYVSVPLLSGESYPYDDWTKTQTVMLPNSANCGKVRIVCANAANDDGPAGVMIGIKYNKQYISSNQQTVENDIIKTINNERIVLSSQSSTTPLSDEPYNAKWIWTCGDDGQWDKCVPGVVNTFEIDLCKLSVANGPKFIDFFIPKDKTVIYWILSIIFVVVNIVLLSTCCFKSSFKKYTKVKHVYFDESDVESGEV